MPDNEPIRPSHATGWVEPAPSKPVPQIPDHMLIRRIGSGAYGEVWLAKTIMGTYRAVKIVYRQTFSHPQPYDREFHGMQKFEPVSRSHDGLVDILQVGRHESDSYYYYVMELADDEASVQNIDAGSYVPKTLASEAARRGTLPFEECLHVGLSLSSALEHLHQHGLVHRDIKPANIIFVNGIPKIADIGLVVGMDTSKSFVGTTGYIPPEGPGTVQADIFSLGMVLYEVSTGYDRRRFPEMPAKSSTGSGGEGLSELKEVIDKACASDIHQRYRTAKEMHNELLLLQAGRSVKWLRLLEKRLVILKRVILAVAAVTVLAGMAYYQAYVGRKFAVARLAASYVANGTRSIDENDLFGSLPWFAQALALQQGDAEHEKRNRTHIGVVLRQCPKIVRMWFRDQPVNDAKFSPDGSSVVTVADDASAILWDLQNDKQRVSLTGHSQAVQGASFTRDGRLVVTASWDKTARVWDVATGRERSRLPHPGTVFSAEFDSTAGRVVTACSDGKVRVWDWNATNVYRLFTNHTSAVRHASFSPDDKRVLTASQDCTALVIDTLSGRLVGLPIEHERPSGWVYDASYSPDGRYIVTASFDKTARILDTQTGLIRILDHHQAVRTARFSPDGRFVLTACWDYTARVWDISSGKPVTPPLKHNSYVMSAAFSSDARRIVTATTQGAVVVWDLASNQWLPPSLFGVFSADGTRFAMQTEGIVQVYDSRTDKPLSLLAATNRISSLILNHDGSKLMTFSPGATKGAPIAQLWDAGTGKSIAAPFLLDTPARDALLTPDGRHLIIRAGPLLYVRNTLTGQPLAPLRHTNEIVSFVVAADSKRVAGIVGTNAYVWDFVSGKLLCLLPHAHPVTHVAFSPDGALAVTATTPPSLEAGEARVWEIESGRPIGQPMKHNDGVRFASFSPNGRFVVTASEDKTAQVWHTATGQRHGHPLRHRDEVNQALFSADGLYIVTACRDATARVWNAETGETFTPPLQHNWGSLAGAQFIGDSVTLLTHRAGEAKVWELYSDTRKIDDLVLVAQLLSAHQSDPGGAALPLTKSDLATAWGTLHSRYPADFATSPLEIVAWHAREADGCERARQWSAAAFHWQQLTRLEPTNQLFQTHLTASRKNLEQSNPAE